MPTHIARRARLPKRPARLRRLERQDGRRVHPALGLEAPGRRDDDNDRDLVSKPNDNKNDQGIGRVPRVSLSSGAVNLTAAQAACAGVSARKWDPRAIPIERPFMGRMAPDNGSPLTPNGRSGSLPTAYCLPPVLMRPPAAGTNGRVAFRPPLRASAA